MVLTHSTTHTYTHPFPTVTLAYFLRYSSPRLNPFAAHVLSTDTISSHLDPDTGRLHTTRIHLKKSRLPNAIFKLLPASLTGGGSGSGPSAGDRASYILETSVVDIREGWMRTESRNLNWTGVLSVVEKQKYGVTSDQGTTDVTTTVVFKSRLGDKIRGMKGEGKWFSGIMGGWGTMGIQKTIENLASKKTKDQLGRSREGMRVVLERLRIAGVYGVLESARKERQIAS